DAQSRLYGAANPTLTYASSGLVNGDTLSGLLATPATATSNVGAYAITQGTLAASSNYALTYVGANLAVTAAPLTVTASAPAVAFPSDFTSNDFPCNSDNGFVSASSAAGPDGSTRTPVGILESLNRYSYADLTGAKATSCKLSFSQKR
ncbi:MAG: hypothetical protein QOD40_81, partial [Alphaproteobacteria bacterium]|nr:hypothetical protein [Alphaproteobacteria bacterium]